MPLSRRQSLEAVGLVCGERRPDPVGAAWRLGVWTTRIDCPRFQLLRPPGRMGGALLQGVHFAHRQEESIRCPPKGGRYTNQTTFSKAKPRGCELSFGQAPRPRSGRREVGTGEVIGGRTSRPSPQSPKGFSAYLPPSRRVEHAVRQKAKSQETQGVGVPPKVRGR